MARWNWKRWAFAIVTGSALTGAFATADDLPKTGESITLKFPGQPDRVVSVVKSTRKADGSIETEVKDAKTGDTFTLVDPAPENKIPAVVPAKPVTVTPPVVQPVAPPLPKPVVVAPPAVQPVVPPLPKPVVNSVPSSAPQPLPPLPLPTHGSAFEAPKSPMAPNSVVGAGDKRVIGGGKLFSREPEGGPATIPHTPAAAAATPPAPVVEDKRPGILGRVFGKKPTPAPITNAMPAPAPIQSVAPPVTAAPTTVPAPLPTVRTNQEPPRVQPAKPVTPPAAPGRVEKVVPPTPVVPPVSAPAAPSASPVPLPKPVAAAPTPPAPPAKPTIPPIAVPSVPTPPPIAVPSVPAPAPVPPPVAVPNTPAPAPVPLPTIPAAPMSKVPAPVAPAVAVKPVAAPEPVKPVVHTPVQTSLPADVESLAKALKDAAAPSARLKAAKELATGAHASSPVVQAALVHAAKTDLCPEVKADCIEHLSKLGHRDPAFVEFLKAACSDDSSEVRLAAKDALAKLK